MPAKHHATNVSVGRPDIQAFVGSLVGHGSSKGVFVTTSSFSTPAVEFVRHLSQRVILIDGAALADLMIEHGVGVRVSRAVWISSIRAERPCAAKYVPSRRWGCRSPEDHLKIVL
ncbi:restriction endonuclease [Gluconobacter sp. Dm-74]|uniref:restriction endonuclease n=1 Tax=Gluconobacter sp. Dm-74 TaxID=2799803 RepID=UPI0032C41A0E